MLRRYFDEFSSVLARHGLYVHVEDVDAHCARSRAAGAEIVDEPADQEYGERRCHCRDPGGYSWYFAQPLRG